MTNFTNEARSISLGLDWWTTGKKNPIEFLFLYCTVAVRLFCAQYWKTAEISAVEEWRIKILDSAQWFSVSYAGRGKGWSWREKRKCFAQAKWGFFYLIWEACRGPCRTCQKPVRLPPHEVRSLEVPAVLQSLQCCQAPIHGPHWEMAQEPPG